MKLKTLCRAGIGLLKSLGLKLSNKKNYQCSWTNTCSPSTEIRLHKGGKLTIGNHLSALQRVLISTGENAELCIGDNVNINKDCAIVAHNNIIIGDNVIFGPGCLMYDHDHDFKKTGIERRKNFVTGTVKVGNGVWFGAHCIVLKNTVIGDNCVFGAGCIIKGEYAPNSLVVQERTERIKSICLDNESDMND